MQCCLFLNTFKHFPLYLHGQFSLIALRLLGDNFQIRANNQLFTGEFLTETKEIDTLVAAFAAVIRFAHPFL